jgi:hypothetical protein
MAFKFVLKLEGVRVAVQIPTHKIIREHKELPNLEFFIGLVSVSLGIVEQNVIVKVVLKEIKLIDYY